MEEKIIHMYVSDDGKYSDEMKERVERYEQDKIREKEELEKAEKNLEKYISASFSLDETVYYLVEFDSKDNYAYAADIRLKTPLGLRGALRDRYPHYIINSVEQIKNYTDKDNRVCYYVQDSGDYLDIYFISVSEIIEEAKYNLAEAQNALKILDEE